MYFVLTYRRQAMARVLTGTSVAKLITEELISRTDTLKQRGVIPSLSILRVGERADDLAYERAALKRCETIGIKVRKFTLPADVSQTRLLDTIAIINSDPGVHGCLMFRPLPKDLDEGAACDFLNPEKDIDGITAGSMARVYSGSGMGFAPCTAQSCMELLKYYDIDPSGKSAVVVGRSLVIGRPVSSLLLSADATVTICHSKTQKIQEIIRKADIVVVATGRAESFGAEYFREEQIVLDVGINWSPIKMKLVGDVDFEAVKPIVAGITPVPDGIGSITTAVLCKHVIEAAEMAQ